jgi:hypothetical protein
MGLVVNVVAPFSVCEKRGDDSNGSANVRVLAESERLWLKTLW